MSFDVTDWAEKKGGPAFWSPVANVWRLVVSGQEVAGEVGITCALNRQCNANTRT